MAWNHNYQRQCWPRSQMPYRTQSRWSQWPGISIAGTYNTSVVEVTTLTYFRWSLTARFMGPTWGPSGANRTQVGFLLVPWALLSGYDSQAMLLSFYSCFIASSLPFTAPQTCTNWLKIQYTYCGSNTICCACMLSIQLTIASKNTNLSKR